LRRASKTAANKHPAPVSVYTLCLKAATGAAGSSSTPSNVSLPHLMVTLTCQSIQHRQTPRAGRISVRPNNRAQPRQTTEVSTHDGTTLGWWLPDPAGARWKKAHGPRLQHPTLLPQPLSGRREYAQQTARGGGQPAAMQPPPSCHLLGSEFFPSPGSKFPSDQGRPTRKWKDGGCLGGGRGLLLCGRFPLLCMGRTRSGQQACAG
jgi:hypothetical protein